MRFELLYYLKIIEYLFYVCDKTPVNLLTNSKYTTLLNGLEASNLSYGGVRPSSTF